MSGFLRQCPDSGIHVFDVCVLKNFGKRTGDQGATTSGAGTMAAAPKISKSERNIIKTMFIIIIAFVVCWSVQSFLILLIRLKVSQTCISNSNSICVS